MSKRELATLDSLDFSKPKGLVGVIVQDSKSGEVLMLAYANREAIEKTMNEGLAYFYSRSRGRLWLKGETSGNFMKVVEILVDCDGDAVIYRVEPTGPACHLGNRSCFSRVLVSQTGQTG